jgi:hypothetical protein
VNKICDFSINGETPSGAFPPEFAQYMKEYALGHLMQQYQSGKMRDFLAVLLLSPFPNSQSGSSSIYNLNSQAARELERFINCMEKYRSAVFEQFRYSTGQSLNWDKFKPDISPVANGQLMCGLVTPGVGIQTLRDLSISTKYPLLQLGVQLNGEFYVLFISPFALRSLESP